MPETALRHKNLRPLRLATASRRRKRMLVNRRDDPREPTILDPGSVEQLDVTDSVGEDHSLAVPVKSAINERLVGFGTARLRQRRSVHDQAVHQTVTRGGELDESAAPDCLVRERLGVETRGELAPVAESHANPFGNGYAGARKTPLKTVPRSVWFQRPSAHVSSFWLPQCPCLPPSSPGKGGKSDGTSGCFEK